MSNEDLRISNVDGENAPHEFLSDIREDAKPAEVERVELAQAASSEQTPKTGRVEAAAPPAPANANPNEVVPDQNNVAHLPASAALDDIRIEGSNLVLVQADGTEIVIVNGALHVPTFMLGDVELPRDTVIAALNDSKINVAAGPDGTDTASPAAPSSGAEFQDTLQPGNNAPTQLAQLLADTQQADPTLGGGEQLTNGVPTITATQLLTLTETATGEGGFEEQTVNGQFGFNGGTDHGVITRVQLTNTINLDEEGSTNGTPNSLTSDGKPVTVTVSADGLTITGTVEGSATPVFVLKVTNIETGAFTFTQSGPLDHPDLGQAGATDALRLEFSYTVTDKNGDSATGVASVDINDDGPTAHDVTGAITENQSPLVTLTAGTDYAVGADGGSVSFGTATITDAPEGVKLGVPQIVVGKDGHSITIVSGTTFDALAAGETAVLHIPYTVTDGDGDAVTQDIAITVTGTNDAPVFTAADPNVSFDEIAAATASETAHTASGSLSFTDVDLERCRSYCRGHGRCHVRRDGGSAGRSDIAAGYRRGEQSCGFGRRRDCVVVLGPG